jgi:hypothetical protein
MTGDYFNDLRNASIRGIVDFFARKSDNRKSAFSNFSVSSGVVGLSPVMPKDTVTFNGKICGGNKNIDMIFSNSIFWNKFNSLSGKLILHNFFDVAGADPIAPITRLTAILAAFFNSGRMNQHIFSAAAARKMNHCVSSNIGAGARAIKRLLSRGTAAALCSFISACFAVENKRAAFPLALSFSRKIVSGTARYRAKLYLALKLMIDKIFFPAIEAGSHFCLSFAGMQVSDFMFSIARLRTKFSHVGSAISYLKWFTAELTSNSNHNTIIPQGV